MAVETAGRPLIAGLKPVDRSFESWWVRPGSATVVDLHGDDRVTVIDPDGGQPAELTVLSPDGREDPAALGASADAAATVVRSLVAAGGGHPFLGVLHARGLRPHDARATRLFGSDSPPGSSQAFRAERDAIAIVAAPGGRLVDGDPPSSALVVEVRRATPRPPAEVELPAPLAEPRLDFRVDLASALAYEVRAGEYIQVIDVQGRQCSDFLAFNRGKLENGLERGLDGVTTRTLMGNAYPSPGLQGKFYDVDMDPLVEVVRDTVGRHDTFALACTREVLRGHGLPRAHQLHRELQRAGHALRDRRAQGLGGAQLLLQHGLRLRQPAVHGRALVAARRLRAAAGDDRPGLRVVGVPGRHRPRERLGDHRRPRARVLAREPLLDRDRPPRDPGG